MKPRREGTSGVVNASLLILFLAGALTLLLWRDAPIPEALSTGDAALWVLSLVLFTDVLVCMSPLSLLFQPFIMPLFGAVCCLEARRIVETPSEAGKRLLLLILLIPLCFLLSARGIWNALLLARAVHADPRGLGASVRLSCVLVIFGLAVLCLLGWILRYS